MGGGLKWVGEWAGKRAGGCVGGGCLLCQALTGKEGWVVEWMGVGGCVCAGGTVHHVGMLRVKWQLLYKADRTSILLCWQQLWPEHHNPWLLPLPPPHCALLAVTQAADNDLGPRGQGDATLSLICGSPGRRNADSLTSPLPPPTLLALYWNHS